jgi:hypothetical protein
MTGAHYPAPIAAADKDNERGDGERVWDLVGAYGPDVTGLCRASTTLVSGPAGMGLSAGPLGTVPRIRVLQRHG